jgi:hypothetical protein
MRILCSFFEYLCKAPYMMVFVWEVQMSHVFAEMGIEARDFIQISASFLLAMLLFFDIRNKKYSWLNYLLLVTLALQCLLFILFRAGLSIKIFAVLMLTTTFIVEVVTNRRKKITSV